MTDSDRATERQLQVQLLKIVQEFHIRYYPGPAGIVEETWKIYEKLEPADYDDADDTQELRMVLPGTKPELSPSRRASVVIRVVGAVLSSLDGNSPPDPKRLRKLVGDAARKRQATPELADQLTDFLAGHLTR